MEEVDYRWVAAECHLVEVVSRMAEAVFRLVAVAASQEAAVVGRMRW